MLTDQRRDIVWTKWVSINSSHQNKVRHHPGQSKLTIQFYTSLYNGHWECKNRALNRTPSPLLWLTFCSTFALSVCSMILPTGDCNTWPKLFPAGSFQLECNWINLIGSVFLGPWQDYFLTKIMEKLWWKTILLWRRQSGASSHFQLQHSWETSDIKEEVRGKVDHDKIWLLIKNFTKTLLNHFIEKQSVPKVVGPNIEISIKWSDHQFNSSSSLPPVTRLLKSWWTQLDRIICSYWIT